jgi:MFS family permease
VLADLVAGLESLGNYWNKHSILQSIAGAFLVGVIGSTAYLTALLLGYLGDQALDQIGSKFETVKGTPSVKSLSRRKLTIFALFGGGIALVFQWAQGVVFAPIQALVLGATWPTIISQFLSRPGETDKDRINQLANDLGTKGTV